MHLLSRLRLRTKLVLLMGLSALALVASIAISASLMHQRMLVDRIDKLHAVVQTTIGFAQSLEAQIAAGRLGRDQALAQFRDQLHRVRFGGEADYILAQSYDGMVIIHGGDPAREGKPTASKDARGRSTAELAREVMRDADGGVISYLALKPGQKQPQEKLSYAGRFQPWQLVLLVGTWTDDMDAAFQALLARLGAIGGGVLAISLLTAWLINRDITGSLGALRRAMETLAHGELETAIPGTERRDEVGGMAGAVLVFKEHMAQAKRLAAERDQERDQAEATKHAALVSMANTIEAEATSALTEVARRTQAMTEAADSMGASATRTGSSAQSAAGAAAQALANAQTVASAAEQLTASIHEIGKQVEHSTAVVGRAVEAGRTTRETISALNEQVGRIGTVADMISEIAARTNLLALNATIEAARAGDAGKGFAVVASEVKQLATQTAKSTEEISRHIGEVRAATGASVIAVGHIEATIEEINAIAGSIAAAVEEQGAATAEISRNVTETAAAANEMSGRTQEVSAEAEQTGHQAVEMRENTAALGGAMQDLNKAIIHLVRTSTSEVDRRGYRRRPCLMEATLTLQGKSDTASLHDISERGCYAFTSLPCQAGQRVDLAAPRFGLRLSGIVAQRSDDGAHITFLDDGIAASEADRISLTTIAELMGLAKNDHVTFTKRVADLVANKEKLSSDSLSTAHHCRFGRWYDSVSDLQAMALPSFKAIKAPHDAVHEFGRRALIALGRDDAAAAQRYVADMHSQSERVLRHLDEFARDYPTTIAVTPAAA